VYVITKRFARGHYWEYFCSKSPAYRQLVSDLKKEARITYILNNKKLEQDQEAKLFTINDTNFGELKVINKKTVSITTRADNP
jgi:hypothetical protein